jgi:hypothetical protein
MDKVATALPQLVAGIAELASESIGCFPQRSPFGDEEFGRDFHEYFKKSWGERHRNSRRLPALLCKRLAGGSRLQQVNGTVEKTITEEENASIQPLSSLGVCPVFWCQSNERLLPNVSVLR